MALDAPSAPPRPHGGRRGAAGAAAPADAGVAAPGARGALGELSPGRWTVAGLAAALDRGAVSPVELLDAALGRIAAVDGEVRAFAHVRADAARAEARRAADRRARGLARGPLDGVPVAVKDLGDRVPGTPVRLGCGAVALGPAAAPSLLVERLQAAGAVIVGTTNVPELGHRVTTDSRAFGPTSTPFAPGRLNAGGSSGGSAAAVAAGMVAAALGSDGAGSIRVPAAFCGVVGLKPTFGLVPAPARPNAFRNGALFVSAGPLTRTVDDARLLLAALAGPHPADPFALPPGAARAAGDAPAPGRPLRVAVAPDHGGFPVEPALAAAVVAAGEVLAAAGHQVVASGLRLPLGHAALTGVVRRAVGWTMLDALEGLLAQGALRADPRRALAPSLLALVDEARATTTDGWRADGAARTAVLDEVERALAPVDVLLAPVTAVAAVPNRPGGWTLGPDHVAGEAVDPTFGWCATWPANLTGHPAASFPAGRVAAPGAGAAGVPGGVQVIGHRGGDAAVLAAGAALERHAPWFPWYRELEGGMAWTAPRAPADTSPST